jgi:hypothetical protein
LTSRDVTLYHRDIGRNPARRQGRYEEETMDKDFGKYVALRSVEVGHGTYLPRGIVVRIAKAGRTLIADTGSLKVRITGDQFRTHFLQYALAEAFVAEFQAVR